MGMESVILAIIMATLGAIVYSLRVLVLMERRVARIDVHIEALVTKVFEQELAIRSEENKIEKEENKIEKMLLESPTKTLEKKTSKKSKSLTKKSSKKTPKKK